MGAVSSSSLTVNSNNISAVNSLGFRNRIINGAMVIDQRNNGASVTPNLTYTLDRWKAGNTQTSKFTVQQNAGSVTPPAGFSNYLGVTSSSAYSVTSTDEFSVFQPIEGFNFSDMAWGTANAQTVTVSFWVRSSLTGTFGGALNNSALNRVYPFSYTVSSANTWEYKTVTIAGDTTGTWVGATNGVGVYVQFGLGVGSNNSKTAGSWQAGYASSATGATSVVGTNGATFYITGVQLEAGSVATPFERRDYGRELMMAQRYYYRIAPGSSSRLMSTGGSCDSATVGYGAASFPVLMRTRPTSVEQSGTASDYLVFHSGSNTVCSAVPGYNAATSDAIYCVTYTVASGLTVGRASVIGSNSSVAYLGWSAEL
jgi:hypothetical protein